MLFLKVQDGCTATTVCHGKNNQPQKNIEHRVPLKFCYEHFFVTCYF